MIKICHLWQNILKIFSLLSGFKKADYKPFNQWIFISRQIAWETVSLTRASLIIKIKNRHIMFHHITLLFKTLQYFLMPYRLNIFWTLKLQYNLDSIFFHILLKASLRHYPFVQTDWATHWDMPSTSSPVCARICVYIYLGWPKSLFEFSISCYRKIQTKVLANKIFASCTG